jgi:hypothetical protein
VSRPPVLRRRPSPAFVLAFIALVAALGGTAIAQTTINGNSIQNHTIKGVKLVNGAVGTNQLASAGVQAGDIKNGAVSAAKLASGAVTNAKLAGGAVTTAKIESGAVTTTQIATGAVTTAQIADNAVGTADIGNASVTRAKLATDALTPQVVVRTSAIVGIVDNAVGQAEANCLQGEVLIAGGAGPTNVASADAPLIASRPQPASGGSVPTGWQGVLANLSGSTVEFQAYAICQKTTA